MVDPLKKLVSGQEHQTRGREKSLKDYQIECEECDEVSYVASYKKPKKCPICGEEIEADEVQDEE